MAKKVLTTIKLQANAGQASPAPPVGPALGQHGINIMEFCKAFNAQTQSETGTIIPVVITVYEDRSFTFVTKTPPAAVLIRQAININKGSAEPNRNEGRHHHPAAAPRHRRAQAPGPQRPRRRAGRQDHRRHGPLDGRGGRPREPRTPLLRAARQGRPRTRVRARRGDVARVPARLARSSTRRSRCTSAPASTSATPTSSCAARSRSPTGSAKTSRSPSSPRATRPAKPRRPAPTTSAARTSPSRSARASTTST